ncbi:hypothetical protein ACHAWF_017105 [Thalassiosira exigua]
MVAKSYRTQPRRSSPSAPSPVGKGCETDGAPLGRRRRRSRISTSRRSESATGPPPPIDDDGGVTSNDTFFEHQRTRGYRLCTPDVSECDAARLLEEEHAVDAVAHYLRHGGFDRSGAASSIADALQSTGAGLSIDLWAAVQRGEGAHHAFHVHDGAVVSGVYYSSCPAGCAPLVLSRPAELIVADATNKHCGSVKSEEDEDQTEDVVIHPREGQMVLFPPWVSHDVPPVGEADMSNAQNPRVSWAFNLTARLASIGDPWNVTRQFRDSSC